MSLKEDYRHLEILWEGQREFIKRIQDALGTAEEGEALIEVARNAHSAEMKLAHLELLAQEEPPLEEHNSDPLYGQRIDSADCGEN